MTETVHMFIAAKEVNELMHDFNLCEPHKSFVTTRTLTFSGRTKSDEEFAKLVVNSDLPGTDGKFKVEALILNDKLYVRKGLRVLSNGQDMVFVNNAQEV